MTTLAWGILGCGTIAKTFANGVARSKTGKLVAVASRSKEKAEAFAKEFGHPTAHGSYEALLADKNVQAVYIAVPHPLHAEWAIRAAQAGKHLLVEKPIALNQFEAMSIIEAAIANDVFLMEAFMYRCHPQTKKLVELLREKVIGDVRVISATFSFHWPKPWNGTHRLTANELGGGGILDVGCYPVSMSRLIAGVAMGKDFADPIKVEGVAHLNAEGTDDYAIGVLKFENEIVAQISTGVQVGQENVVHIYGSDGFITVPTPWVPPRDGGSSKIIIHKAGEAPREITIDCPDHLYALEADTVAHNVNNRQSREMSWDDSMGNMKTLDGWRKSIGQIYNAEKPENIRPKTLDVKPQIPHASIPHVMKKASRLIMGVDNQFTMPHAQVMFDDFFQRGGNTFDTAHIYAGGVPERLFGQWVKSRNVREQIVIIAKGAHTPFCNPRDLVAQLTASLDRMQIEQADLYLMHRDNTEIPVSEFIDCLNEQVRLGRINAFGGSNWSLARVEQANSYAKSKGLRGFSAVSNNFSLARMVEAPWNGCIAASDPESRAWLTKNQLPLLAWSSQARGFFLAEHRMDDPDLKRCWFSDDNFARRERVTELAKKKNVLPINIALAYVLHQSFPTFALIGPRTLAETRTSLPALDIELTSEEVKWLNLE